jgi:hypothetical protein
VQAYKQKHAAAWKLGDVVKQEEVLREWAQMDTDIDPRWRLMSFLFFSSFFFISSASLGEKYFGFSPFPNLFACLGPFFN